MISRKLKKVKNRDHWKHMRESFSSDMILYHMEYN